jgi:hypothetical protein
MATSSGPGRLSLINVSEFTGFSIRMATMNHWARRFGTNPIEVSFMTRDEYEPGRGGLMSPRLRRVLVPAILIVLTACGDTPLDSIGWRSSDWINEPTVPTTVAVVTTTPTVVSAERLLWANDEIETASLEDQGAVIQEVFGRREGDRFIQASRFEIAAALPGVAFPGLAPSGAEWVTSQLVVDNDGTVSPDPSAAFGIWSTEPYTRSRSVAQMVVMRVATDPVAAEEVASADSELSCERFAERSADQCEILTIADRPTWLLEETSGSTLIWFEGEYRYELFGRSFVPRPILREMTAGMVPLASLTGDSS